MKTQCALFFLLVTAAVHASATTTFSLQPAAPIAGQAVALRIDDASGCFRVGGSTITRDGGQVKVDISLSDFFVEPCPSQHVSPVYLSLGSLPAATYQVSIRLCGNFPINPCIDAATLGLTVGSLPRPSAIPALGWIGLLLSCCGIVATPLLMGGCGRGRSAS